MSFPAEIGSRGTSTKRKVESELAELFELVRAELASMRAEMHDAMTETAAVLSVRVRTEIEQRMGEPSALVTGIQESARPSPGATPSWCRCSSG